MTQNVLDYSQNPSGIELMDVFLAGMAANQLTNHSGVSRPSYAQNGTFWIDTSATPWVLKQFNGTNDVIVGSLDQTNLYFTAPRAIADANGNNIASTYLPTTGTAAKAIADANGNNIASTYLPRTGTAAKATADASGNNIANTYATKTELDQKSSFKLFHHDWFDYELNDMAWLRADTFSWQDGTVYSNAYNHLVADISGKTATSETVGSYTISYYLADDGHKITTDETTVANIYNESGVAWYYILDTTNQRFKLPRTKYGFVGLRDAVGKYVPESLPNITGSFGPVQTDWGGASAGGANYISQPTGGVNSTAPYGQKAYIGFDASRSSSAYQDNAPVQQRATQMYLYFYVGNFAQSATEQTAGLNSELFNGKLDLDAGNATSSTKETIVGWGMPDYTAGISLNYSSEVINTFTASYDCLVVLNVFKGGSGNCSAIFFKQNSEGDYYIRQDVNQNTGRILSCQMYVPKGYTVYPSINGDTSVCVYYPLKGVNTNA